MIGTPDCGEDAATKGDESRNRHDQYFVCVHREVCLNRLNKYCPCKKCSWLIVTVSFFVISFSLTFSMSTGTSVTLNAIIEIANAFLDMLTAYVVWCVFVTTIAGVPLVVVARMASYTGGIVVTIKSEILAVLKGRR